MERGILLLTQVEYLYLAELLQTESVQAQLLQKFKPSSAGSGQNIKIQLSSEEVESLLDLLPMPDKSEPTALTTTRQKLQSFLTELH